MYVCIVTSSRAHYYYHMHIVLSENIPTGSTTFNYHRYQKAMYELFEEGSTAVVAMPLSLVLISRRQGSIAPSPPRTDFFFFVCLFAK